MSEKTMNLKQMVRDVERSWLEWALGQTKGNKKRAAELLGLQRTCFTQKCKRLAVKWPFERRMEPGPSSPPPVPESDVNQGHV